MSTSANSAASRSTPAPVVAIEAQSSDASDPPPVAAYSATMPSRATARPSVVRTRYFQPASSALRRPLEATSSADAAVVASISSHATARLSTIGTASSVAQNRYSAT
jgi:hypothetical protein